MRWHTPRRFHIEDGDILVVTKDGLDKEDWFIVIGCSIYGALAIFFAMIPYWTGPRPDEGDCWLLAAAIGCTVIVTGVRWLRRYRGSLGCWRVGPDAIEFVGARGPTRRLEWAEVARVRWFRFSFKVEGPPGTIELTRGGLPDDDWGRVRAAVEAALTPRFALAEPIPEPEWRWSRLAVASLPPCVLVGGEALLMRGLASSPRVLAWSLFGMLTLLAGYCSLLFKWSRREWVRRTWRHPRPVRLEGD